jgi:micrococcal nuclease
VGGAAVVLALLLSGCGSTSSAGTSPEAIAPAVSAASSTTPGAPATTTPAGSPRGDTVSGLTVERVVDGDTVKVVLDGGQVSVRLIGMNTPETVKPDSPVECYAPESSDYAKSVLTGATVTLEFDDSQGRTDQYDRVLAYVWRELPDGGLSLFNLESIAQGYAFERQYGSEYAWKDEFVRAQEQAQGRDAGLWGACDYS